MQKAIRYVLLFTGLGLAFYGALKDIDSLTIPGAFLIVVALMFNIIINAVKPKNKKANQI